MSPSASAKIVLFDEFALSSMRLPERFVVPCLGARVGLRQRLYWLLHQPDADPFAVRFAMIGP